MPERFVICSDTHGDKIDQNASAAFLDFVKFWKPSRRIHLGDVFNLACLRQGADEEEVLGLDLRADIDAGKDFLDQYRPDTVLMGNHDHRVIRKMRSKMPANSIFASAVWDTMRDAMGDAIIVPWGKRKGVSQLGNFRLIHGYASGIGATRKHALTYGNVIAGHNHCNDHTTLDRWDRTEGYAVGCLAALDQEYNEGQLTTLRQEHGFIYGYIMPSGGLNDLPSEANRRDVALSLRDEQHYQNHGGRICHLTWGRQLPSGRRMRPASKLNVRPTPTHSQPPSSRSGRT